jgi:pyruvate formate lyase activating enzyme
MRVKTVWGVFFWFVFLDEQENEVGWRAETRRFCFSAFVLESQRQGRGVAPPHFSSKSPQSCATFRLRRTGFAIQNLRRHDMHSALTFDIKRYAINDGPGIRVTIFLKGCPLNCLWCHNPESISPNVQKLFTASKCIGCGECVKVCPTEACKLAKQRIITAEELCNLCGKCAEVCPTLATEMSGQQQSVAKLLEIIEKERPFFDQSGGGVTFSGGEPLLYPEFLCEILDACGGRNIHRCIDTAGLANTDILLEVAKRTDLFLYDLKHMDSEKHKQWTGVGNELILQNLEALAASGADIQIRLPLIGGVNTDTGNIAATAAFVAHLPGSKKSINLLPYHNIAGGKDLKLGQQRDLSAIVEPTSDQVAAIVAQFAEHDLLATVGG